MNTLESKFEEDCHEKDKQKKDSNYVAPEINYSDRGSENMMETPEKKVECCGHKEVRVYDPNKEINVDELFHDVCPEKNEIHDAIETLRVEQLADYKKMLAAIGEFSDEKE